MPTYYSKQLLLTILSIISLSHQHKKTRAKNNQKNSKDARLGHRLFQKYLRKNCIQNNAEACCDGEQGLVCFAQSNDVKTGAQDQGEEAEDPVLRTANIVRMFHGYKRATGKN